MVITAAMLYLYWKIFKRTKVVDAIDVDLVWEGPLIDAYENGLTTTPSGFWRELWGLLGWKAEKEKLTVDDR
ncbi:hypothetical protein N7532_009253 [Penicillium argentinense]|uniref:Uncharacterized protein n=1 Tax=Penicillium argentinense TaxID=1131581 RepID=A0A9W9K2C1_9EURO|nr:uncharacterized protein N7532_009253 [Penicillium argentinense]KAJ5090569.1 hypothetical protein N7532_009253 [Penicillium argentinense]